MNKKLGRPLKQFSDLPKDWKEKMMELACQGGSEVEQRAYVLGISKTVWYRWKEEEPAFKETVGECEAACHGWWERKGRLNLENKDFSYAGWNINMKNRFGWTDRQKILGDEDAPIEIKQQIDINDILMKLDDKSLEKLAGAVAEEATRASRDSEKS
jgi:hypothetical protein